jgi:hypothetical protein
MRTIPKDRLSIIGIQDDVSITINPNSIIVQVAGYGFLAASAAVVICLSIQLLRMF